MNIKFQLPGSGIHTVSTDPLIFKVYVNKKSHYVDLQGNDVAFEEPADKEAEELFHRDKDIDLCPESITEVKYEIDDVFGLYGYKDREGSFVIEPQYACADYFSNGLAAVNLNRTWYLSEDGDRYYENHYGYINKRGKTVIPFMYDEAYPFTKYGVAVVDDRKGIYPIDTEGNRLPGTEELFFNKYYEFEDRFLTFTEGYDDYDDKLYGIYDTVKREVLRMPFAEDVLTDNEKKLLEVWEYISENDTYEYYLDYNGDVVYPWLKKGQFFRVSIPDSYGLSAVKPYDKEGVYSSKGRFVVAPKYDNAQRLADGLYGLVKDGVVTVVQIGPEDLEEDAI